MYRKEPHPLIQFYVEAVKQAPGCMTEDSFTRVLSEFDLQDILRKLGSVSLQILAEEDQNVGKPPCIMEETSGAAIAQHHIA